MAYLRVYTREILGEEYPSALANSVHMALQVEGEEEKPLNQNYGILFPKAKICGDNTLEERGVRSPGVFRRGNTYFIVGEQVDGLGQPVRKRIGGSLGRLRILCISGRVRQRLTSKKYGRGSHFRRS